MYWMSKSRYRGTVLLALAVFVAGLLNYLFSQYRMQDFSEDNPQEDIRVLDSLLALLPQEESAGQDWIVAGQGGPDEADSEMNLSSFNPNKISKENWLEMGLPEKAYQSLDRYRQKGGIFRSPGQVFQIPHLSREQAEKMLGFIRLDTGSRKKYVHRERKKEEGPFNLNLADSLQLKSVFGIGSKTASRILEYRRNLGGFIKEEQLYEVWGLDSLVAQELMETSFLPDPPGIRKINPNTASEEDLIRHPYIRKGLGRLIVRYRKHHSPFAKPEDLLGIKLFRQEQVEKLRPYLSFEP